MRQAESGSISKSAVSTYERHAGESGCAYFVMRLNPQVHCHGLVMRALLMFAVDSVRFRL
jgi:hypothetical protein